MAGEANLLLDAALDRAGLSHAGLARRLNAMGGWTYDHASVARWIRDHAVPRDPVPALICRILTAQLGVPVEVADIGMSRTASPNGGLPRVVDRAAALWQSDQKHRPVRVVAGTEAISPVWEWENPPEDTDVSRRGQRAVEVADVVRLRRARDRYQEMYRRVGGIPVRPRIVAALTGQAAPLLHAAYDNRLGRDLFHAAAGLSALAGVCAYDADQQALAQRHLFTALRLAKASGDKALGAYVVAVIANQALYLDQHRLVIQYAQTALRAAGTVISPALAADLHSLAGKAYGRMGDIAGCHSHLRHAEAIAARLGSSGLPAEVSYIQPGLVETQVAEALRRLGDLAAAHTYAEQAAGTADTTHLRGRVHRYAGLALIQAGRGHIDAATRSAAQMLNAADGMESGRLRDRILTVLDTLRPYETDPAVADLLETACTDHSEKGT